MPKNNPCAICKGGVDCADCLDNPQNSEPIKLYTPKGAARAMLAGKVLKNEKGHLCFWEPARSAFVEPHDNGDFFLTDFSGLYSDGKPPCPPLA